MKQTGRGGIAVCSVRRNGRAMRRKRGSAKFVECVASFGAANKACHRLPAKSGNEASTMTRPAKQRGKEMIKRIEARAAGGEGGGSLDEFPVPAGLDHDLYLGPAPMAPCTKDRITSRGSWYSSHYAPGFVSGWGARSISPSGAWNKTSAARPLLPSKTPCDPMRPVTSRCQPSSPPRKSFEIPPPIASFQLMSSTPPRPSKSAAIG